MLTLKYLGTFYLIALISLVLFCVLENMFIIWLPESEILFTKNQVLWTLLSLFTLNTKFTLELPSHSLNGFKRTCPSGFPTGITCSTYCFFFFSQGRFLHVTAGCREASDSNSELLNEPKGSTGHGKSTPGQPWHSNQLLGLSKSIFSALSNVLWDSNSAADLTQMKPFHPFSAPYGTTTTYPA